MKSLRYQVIISLLISAVVAGCSSAQTEKPNTKLGILILGGGGRQSIRTLIGTGNVRVIKTDDMATIRSFKERNPQGVVDLPMIGGSFSTSKDDPVEAARKRWDTYIAPKIAGMKPADKALIDYVEVSPNMNEPHSVQEAQWWNKYAEVLCKLVGDSGFKPLIYTIGVGGIPCSNERELAILEAMIPSLRSAHKYGGGWAYHGYTINYTTDVPQELSYSLRYRRAYALFQAKAPDLMTMPIILSEGGVDKLGDPLKDGYAFRGSREDYARWLAWYDSEIKKDPYVVGVTLFKIGSGGWESFDLDPMVPWLTRYYKTGSMTIPEPKTKLGIFLYSEKKLSDPVRKVCAAKTPIIYTGPSEIKPGGIIETYKKANPNGLVVVRMRSDLPDRAKEPDPKVAAKKKWDEMVVTFIAKLSDKQHAMVDFIDATPGPVELKTADDITYYNRYIDTLTQWISENRFRPIISAFDARTAPATQAEWNRLGPHFFNIWRDKGEHGGAIIYHADVTAYMKDAKTLEAGPLKYRQMYASLLKYIPSMVPTTPVIVIAENRTSADKAPAAPYTDWLQWYDSEVCKDLDVLGVALFKVGGSGSAQWTDLSSLLGWYTSYVNQRVDSKSPYNPHWRHQYE